MGIGGISGEWGLGALVGIGVIIDGWEHKYGGNSGSMWALMGVCCISGGWGHQ